jgi:WD40 repeat protein
MVFDKYVFTGSADTTVKKWDLASNKCMFTYSGHTSKVHKILVTKDLLFTTSNDKTAKCWHSKITKANRLRPSIRTFKVIKNILYAVIKSDPGHKLFLRIYILSYITAKKVI